MTLPIVFHPQYEAPLRQGHRFPMSKYGELARLLRADGLMGRGDFIAPAPAPAHQIAAAHGIDYTDRVLNGTLCAAEERRIGLPQTKAVALRARLSAAGSLLAGWLALEHGLACNAAGGSHHAGPGYGSGFCVFNDVGVAARALVDQGAVRRVLVVDLDVHQGDGTARIFENDPRIFTLSVHAGKNFPARKAVSDMDVALPDGTRDQAYMQILRSALGQALARSKPDLVFYNAGVDPYREDRLGRLSLSMEGLRARDRYVLESLRAKELPVAGVLGGGYSHDPAEVARRHKLLFEEAARLAE